LRIGERNPFNIYLHILFSKEILITHKSKQNCHHLLDVKTTKTNFRFLKSRSCYCLELFG
jgi:hypothetical protein